MSCVPPSAPRGDRAVAAEASDDELGHRGEWVSSRVEYIVLGDAVNECEQYGGLDLGMRDTGVPKVALQRPPNRRRPLVERGAESTDDGRLHPHRVGKLPEREVLLQYLEASADETLEAFIGWRRVGQREGLAHVRHALLEDRVEHALFSLEVAVEKPLRDVRRIGDHANRRALVAVLGEERQRGIENTLACRRPYLLVLLGRSRAHDG